MTTIPPSLAAFVRDHRHENPQQLALAARRFPDVDMPAAIRQIEGWQTARTKLPTLAANDDIVYPTRLSMEQCSSELTATYKQLLAASLRKRWQKETEELKPFCLTDLTGGFGVDTLFLARAFDHATYVERNETLCHIAQHNFDLLCRGHIDVLCSEAEAHLQDMEHTAVIFADPARRDARGGRTFAIADCTPDICALLPLLRQKARWTLVKLSPMLDWHKAVADLRQVEQVHIVAVDGECKELLLLIDSKQPPTNAPTVTCADLSRKLLPDNAHDATGTDLSDKISGQAITFSAEETEMTMMDTQTPVKGHFLYEPHAAIMKSGCFAALCRRFALKAVAQDSHLFVAETPISNFPGRAFVVDDVATMNKRELKAFLTDSQQAPIRQANVAVRHFPLTAAELQRRLKVADGGNHYIFGTTTHNSTHLLLRCHKNTTPT